MNSIEILGLILLVSNVGIIALMLAQFSQTFKNSREKVSQLPEKNPNVAQFLHIKNFRPTHGSHIFVWDAVEKKALPTVYLGSEEDWRKAKDGEGRFTHFVELPLPR